VPDILNLRLLGHPLNWVIVWAILALMLVGYGLVHDALASKNSNLMTMTGS
jgi:hypothetical protein